MFSFSAFSQNDHKLIRQGNRDYKNEKYPESEILYRKAIDKNKESSDAHFNTGDALYKQKKFEDAAKTFIDNEKMYDDKKKRSASLYNLGNSMLMANKVQESIEAYKGSLKLDPENLQTKYNLAYAQDLLMEQQQQQQQQNQDKNDQKDDQDKKDDKRNQENKDDKNQNQQQKGEQQQKISKEDAERLLNALANDEKNIQEKVKLAKVRNERVRTLKNW
jgi:hypothetical protein